jgi:hypothetical protein
VARDVPRPKRARRIASGIRFKAASQGSSIATDNPRKETEMAELTVLESKLAEVLGLAAAARGATEKVMGMLEEDERDLASQLERMNQQARETEERCTEVAGELDGKKTAIVEKAGEVRREATEMMRTYLAGEDEALDGFEFLTMAEAGEVGHWAILRKLNERAGIGSVAELADWALPIQEAHFKAVLEGSLTLAAREDPAEIEG